LPKPTIAAVNGPAVAGGAGLVTGWDPALAGPEAKVGYSQGRRGPVAAVVMPHLLRLGRGRIARRLLVSGELIRTEEGRTAGLVKAVVPADELLPCARGGARSLAEGGPKALARTKELLTQFSTQATSVEEAARASASPRLTEECRQGLEAFFAKRSVPWAPQ